MQALGAIHAINTIEIAKDVYARLTSMLFLLGNRLICPLIPFIHSQFHPI